MQCDDALLAFIASSTSWQLVLILSEEYDLTCVHELFIAQTIAVAMRLIANLEALEVSISLRSLTLNDELRLLIVLRV